MTAASDRAADAVDVTSAAIDARLLPFRPQVQRPDAHGLSNPEIAGLLGCSLATAKIRVTRARNRLVV